MTLNTLMQAKAKATGQTSELPSLPLLGDAGAQDSVLCLKAGQGEGSAELLPPEGLCDEAGGNLPSLPLSENQGIWSVSPAPSASISVLHREREGDRGHAPVRSVKVAETEIGGMMARGGSVASTGCDLGEYKSYAQHASSVQLVQDSLDEKLAKRNDPSWHPELAQELNPVPIFGVANAVRTYHSHIWDSAVLGLDGMRAAIVGLHEERARGEAGTSNPEAGNVTQGNRTPKLAPARAAKLRASEVASTMPEHVPVAVWPAESPSPPLEWLAHDVASTIWDARGSTVLARNVYSKKGWAVFSAAVTGPSKLAADVELLAICLSQYVEEIVEAAELPVYEQKNEDASGGTASRTLTRTQRTLIPDASSEVRPSVVGGTERSEVHPLLMTPLAKEGQGSQETHRRTKTAEELQEKHSAVSAQGLAAIRLQRAWRDKCRRSHELAAVRALGWSRKQLRAFGPLEANARFLQDLFRETRRRNVNAWTRGGMRGQGRRFSPSQHRCGGGANLATEQEWKAQQKLGLAWLEFYSSYTKILARLKRGSAAGVLHAFCGGGGSTEGVTRAGGPHGHGIDNVDQQAYRERFGAECFTCGDALDWSKVASLQKEHDLLACFASPPCKWYSTARRKDQQATQPPLIPETRNMLRALFDFWAIENVAGARSHMHEGSAELHGSLFGLRVARARLFEANFEIVVDAAVAGPAAVLRDRTCLGKRRRWKRVDRWGRPEGPCCPGNIYAVQGTQPYKCTTDECARAMGIELDHMPYDRLAQAIPPAYSQLLYGQLCMRVLERDYGMRAITFDEHLSDVANTSAYLRGWMRGAGDPAKEAGLHFVQAEDTQNPSMGLEARIDGGEEAEPETEFRELYYSKYGGFDERWGDRGSRHPLDCLRPHVTRAPQDWSTELLRDSNTLIEGEQALLRIWAEKSSVIAQRAPGTRVTLLADASEAERFIRLGFAQTGYRVNGKVAFTIGKRGVKKSEQLDHDEAESWMDPRDRGVGKEPKQAIRERAWKHMNVEGSFWANRGLPDKVEEYMTHGVGVTLVSDLGGYEVAQYPYASAEARAEAAMETDRAIAVGHLSYVPDAEAEKVRENTCVHPWTMAFNGEKWRACQDYSVGTNRVAASAPFGLPTPWDVRRMIRSDTHFAKYDLRDGFWRVPVKEELRRRLVLRHPANGRLVWCNTLPFGFVDSPRAFCFITEAVAQEWRKRVAQRLGTQGGLYILCYVDDYLIIGDNADLVRQGGEIFEELLHELGIEWAPHKQRGPSRVMEFLGLLLCNIPGRSVIGLSRARQTKLLAMFDEWMRRRPKKGKAPAKGRGAEAEPKQLAKLLGHLVFASQVVPGGRIYMQNMLRQFAGLEIDWRRGVVRWSANRVSGSWGKVELTEGFWEDLEWWRAHLEYRNCSPLVPPERAEAAITGTDASDWGTGQAVFLDGGLEEARLRFTQAERRHPINWRELLGITRIFEWYGVRLAGRTVLVETDNMAARGAVTKMSSSSEAMAELLRRILDICERQEITVRCVHTPGEKLHRPDQSSRGDAIEEPRVRLTREAFLQVAKSAGPFTHFIGSERQYGQQEIASAADRRLFAHPTFSTVGSTLRHIGTMMQDHQGAQGIVLVPEAPEAGWWSMLRHFACIGRWPAGSAHLEDCLIGTGRSVRSRRPTLILSFPRAAGAMPRQLTNETGRDGRGRELRGKEWHLHALEGSIVYQPGRIAGQPGCLYWLAQPYDGSTQAGEACSAARVAELWRWEGRRHDRKGPAIYSLDLGWVKDEYGRHRAGLATGDQAWEVEAHLLWTVDHLVHEVEGGIASLQTKKANLHRPPRTTTQKWLGLWERAFRFDYRDAEAQIARAIVTQERGTAPQGKSKVAIQQWQSSKEGATEAEARSDVVVTEGRSGPPGSDKRYLPERRQTRLATKLRREEEDGRRGDSAGAAHSGTLEGAGEERSTELLSEPPPANMRQEVSGQQYNEASILIDQSIAKSKGEVDLLKEEVTDEFDGLTLSEARQEAGEIAAIKAATAEKVRALQKSREKKALACKDEVTRAELVSAHPASHRPMLCRGNAFICEGCRLRIQVGEQIIAVAAGVVHAKTKRCEELARQRLIEEGLAKGPVDRDRLQLQVARKQTQLAHRYSDERCGLIMDCLNGLCQESEEQPVLCMNGCGRGLHVMACARATQARARLGKLRCITCRVEAMSKSSCTQKDSPSMILQRSACRSLLDELLGGAESTAKNLTEFERLCKAWALDMSEGDTEKMADLQEPRYCEESFLSLLNWLVTDAGRARSFTTLVRGFGIALSKMELTDWTRRPRVKAVIKEITGNLGLEPEPCILPSRRIIRIGLDTTIPRAAKGNEYILARSIALLTLELAGGLRVGEATGGGELHGLLANQCRLAQVLQPNKWNIKEMVLCQIDSSKTKFGRCVAICGETQGALNFKAAQHIRKLWAVSGFSLTKGASDGLTFERPDYWVVKITIIDMRDEVFERLLQAFQCCQVPEVLLHARYSVLRLQEKRRAKTLGEEKQSVNIAGGALKGREVVEASAWLNREGFEKYTDVVEGPLLRATHGPKVTHMPLQPGSTYTHLGDAMLEAYSISAKLPELDTELDLGGCDPEHPKMGNHWARRKADQVARDNMNEMEVDEELIDEQFGWNQMARRKKQQIHYSGTTELLKLARLTYRL